MKSLLVSVRGTFSDDKEFQSQEKCFDYIKNLINDEEECVRITIDTLESGQE